MAHNELDRHEVSSFVRDLILATREGRTKWSASDTAEFFYLETAGGTVNIRSEGEGEHPIVFRIYDDQGRQMYEMRTEVAPFYGREEGELAQLFAAARSSVFDVQGTLRNIRESLDL